MGSGTAAVVTGDFNLDGVLDLAASNDFADNVAVRTYDGTAGDYGPPTTYPVGFRPGGLQPGDLNGDGYPDLVTANVASHNISVLVNDAVWTDPGPGGGPGYEPTTGFDPLLLRGLGKRASNLRFTMIEEMLTE
jgi:hypothetical protein